MVSYIIRRLLILIPMILIISFLIFLGIELTPGDAVSYMVSPEALANMSPESLAEMRASLGLDQPFHCALFQLAW